MPVSTSPFVLTDVTLTLKVADDVGSAVEYRCQLNRAELVPATSTGGTGEATFETFCARHNTAGEGTTTDWTLELTAFQAWSDATDLSRFLFLHEGELLDYVLTPAGGAPSETNPAFEGQVTARPTPIGGTANQYAQAVVSLPCTGKPEMVTV